MSVCVFLPKPGQSAARPAQLVTRQPFDRWPEAFKYYATRRSIPGDRGLGDVLARDFGRIGGRLFRRWYKAVTGRDCGCEGRRDRLNERYPLPKTVDLSTPQGV